MELRICTSLGKVSHTYCPCYPKSFSNSHLFRRTKLWRRLNSHSGPLRVVLCCEKVSTTNGNPLFENQEGFGNSFEEFKFIEVIGIGSRKDAVLDFCLDSPLLRSSLRFWNILNEDSVKAQLQQRVTRKDIIPSVMEAPSALLSCSKAIVLVATAAYGLDHIRVVDILKGVKSANRLVVAIILKPFSFEGRRRQFEVKDLVEKLQEHTNFCIVIDPDVLLEKDLVTLDEALKTANTAVLMAINAISVLVSENQKKLLASPQNYMKEVNVSEAIEILQRYKDARIGFGAGYNIETSIMRAVFDCPFLSGGLKDLGGIVICILASSAVVESSDMNSFVHTFRQTIECRGEIIISLIHDSSLEPNLIVATVITVGHTRHHASQESSLLSRLAQHFPLIFNLLRRHHPKSDDTMESYSPENPFSEVRNSPEPCEMENIVPADSTTEGLYSAELQTLLNNNDGEIYYSSSEQEEIEFSETMNDSSDAYYANIEELPSFQMEPLSRWNLGQRYQISDGWSNEGGNDCGATPMLDSLSIYKPPVGVKLSEELKSSLSISNTIHHQEKVAEKGIYRDAMPDAGFEAVSELYDNASAVSNGNSIKKQGVLSVRAASMLEAERDSQKKWNPMVEMKYRGGIYKGRCQGGLPEGKGRLSLKDGSIYDGTWHYGKRSGLGTFYFSNGDVYQGSWRDDVMHGKGWLYFHTGDRWFVNFWKGKANGEGRFYSKFGEILFGHFKDGWRHGHFLCIHVDGTRYLEIWKEGILQSRKQLDADAGSGSV